MSDNLGAYFLIANLIVLGLNLKIYTEYVKDRRQDARNAK